MPPNLPTLIFATPASEPAWARDICAHLSGEFRCQRFQTRRRLVARLARAAAAALFIDATRMDWRQWLILPKASPATRRIPIFFIGEKSEQRATALASGADFAFSPTTIANEAPVLLAKVARKPNAAERAALACACAGTLPALAREGIAQFNAGHYYQQHDLFEELWVKTSGSERDLYRAILQIGVAYYHIERGNWRGAYKMLLRSQQWLHWLPAVCQGVDVAALQRDSRALQAALERLGEARLGEIDRALLRPVIWNDGS